MSAAIARRGMDELTAFELRLALRGRGPIVGALVYGIAMGAVAFVGLASFRQVGVGALTPAATGLLEIGLLVPTLVALVTGGSALHGEGDRDLRAAGISMPTILLAKLLASIAGAMLVVLAGSGVAALVLASSVRLDDLVPFGFLVLVTFLASASASSIGLLISALARDRVQAVAGSIAAWTILAVGVDLAVLLVGPALGAGPVLALAALVDPIESARLAGLVALGADSHVLGALGTYIAAVLGPSRAVSALIVVLVLWILVPFAVACAALRRAERG